MNRVTGSIQNKNNKGIYHMMVRIKTPDGNAINKSKSTGIRVGSKANRREAELKLSAWIKELEAECEAKNQQRLIQAIND